jgi:hypothetical protein
VRPEGAYIQEDSGDSPLDSPAFCVVSTSQWSWDFYFYCIAARSGDAVVRCTGGFRDFHLWVLNTLAKLSVIQYRT